MPAMKYLIALTGDKVDINGFVDFTDQDVISSTVRMLLLHVCVCLCTLQTLTERHAYGNNGMPSATRNFPVELISRFAVPWRTMERLHLVFCMYFNACLNIVFAIKVSMSRFQTKY